MKRQQDIYCIGDSHISVFLGKDMLAPFYPETVESAIPQFNVNRIGPITAYNVNNPDSSTGAKAKIDDLVNRIKRDSVLIFCIGEIDLRVHVLKQVQRQNSTVEAVCSAILDRYFELLNGYAERGHTIILVSAPPTSYSSNDDPEYPKFGSETERNIASKEYNRQLQERAQAKAYGFIDIFSPFISDDFLTKRGTLWDDVHPASFVLKTIIRQLNEKYNFHFTLPVSWHLRQFLKNTYKKYDRNGQKIMA